MSLSDTARSLAVIDEVIEGHRSDIKRIVQEMDAMKNANGWLIKVPGFGYDALMHKLRDSRNQLEGLLLFRESVHEYVRSVKSVGLYCINNQQKVA